MIRQILENIDIQTTGNYIWRFSNGFGVVVKDLGEWRPGFYSEFRYASREHSGLPWGAIFRNVLVLSLIPSSHVHFFQEQVPKMCSFGMRCTQKGAYQYIYILTGPQNQLFPVFPRFRVLGIGYFQYFQDSGFLEWVLFSTPRIQGSWNGLFPVFPGFRVVGMVHFPIFPNKNATTTKETVTHDFQIET